MGPIYDILLLAKVFKHLEEFFEIKIYILLIVILLVCCIHMNTIKRGHLSPRYTYLMLINSIELNITKQL